MGTSKIVTANQARRAAAVLKLRIFDLADCSLEQVRENDALLLAIQATEIAESALDEYLADMAGAIQSDIEEASHAG